MIITLIFIALIPLFYSLSASPGGFCPPSQYLTTDSYILDTTASYGPAAYSSPIIATVTFTDAQENIHYKVALSFQNLDYQIINNRISIMINYTNPTLSSFDLNFHSAFTNRIRLISIRYMVINSNGSFYLSVSYIIFTPNSYRNSVSKTSALEYFPRSNTDYYIIYTGFDYDYSNNPIHYIGRLSVTYSSTSVTIGFYNIDAQCNYVYTMMYSYSVLFIRYLTNTPVQIDILRISILSSSTRNNIIITTRNTLFGLDYVYPSNEAFFNFNISITDGTLKATTVNAIITSACSPFSESSVLVISKYYTDCCISPTSYYYPIDHRCYDICPPRLYGAYNFSCLFCPFDCLYCNNTGNGECISCQPSDYRTLNTKNNRCIAKIGYYSYGNISRAKRCAYDCIQCSSLIVCKICVAGKTPVTGGCSNVFGCAQVNVNFTINITKCIACKRQFVLTKDNLCSCQWGSWLVTGHCTNVIGCLQTIRINNVTKCAACKLRFIYSNNSCVCIYGFKLQDEVDECNQICGDGILFVLKCDDGNLIDGDGCSSTCKIEFNYKCFDGSSNHSSICFLNQNYSVAIYSIDKTSDKNQGIFIFKISPISRKQIISSLIFSCYQNITFSNWYFDNNLITVKIDYYQDLQGNSANLSLKLNQKYTSQPYLNISLEMKSGGIQLIIFQSYGQIQNIKKIIFVISIYVVFLFVIGSIAYKMIGVQILTTFQIILFTITLNTKFTVSYNIFNYLSPVSGDYYYLTNQQSNYYSHRPSLVSLSNYSEDSILLTMEVTAGIFIGCFFITVGRIVFWAYFEKTNCDSYIQKIAQFSYNNILFPLTIGLLFINVFSNILSSTKNAHTIIIYLFVTITSSLVFFYQLIYFFISRPHIVELDNKLIDDSTPFLKSVHENKDTINKFQRCNKRYIPCYLLFIYVEFNIFLLTNMNSFKYSSSITITIAFIFFFWFILEKPYQDTIHNIGQIFNIVLILIFSFWSILRQIFPKIAAESNQITVLYFFLGLIIVVLFLTTARVIVQFRRKFICSKKTQSKEVQIKKTDIKRQKMNTLSTQYNDDEKMRKNDKYMNPYSIKTQLLREQQLRWDEINKQRIQNNTKPLVSDKFHLVNKSQNISLVGKNAQMALKKQMNSKDKSRQKGYLLQRIIKQ